ncbi:hypothetical protein [Mesorhizobium australicum]|uniref:hypothetical protein n=1 Tax=Mesorhizobium australicum TaxID=536018 RepID=UPI001593E694|nr:hypothetical protein [Mesorhizobium australicum]
MSRFFEVSACLDGSYGHSVGFAEVIAIVINRAIVWADGTFRSRPSDARSAQRRRVAH